MDCVSARSQGCAQLTVIKCRAKEGSEMDRIEPLFYDPSKLRICSTSPAAEFMSS
jgi:hypothetical protein